MGQQYYIKSDQCEQIHALGHIKSEMFNMFVELAIAEKLERDESV